MKKKAILVADSGGSKTDWCIVDSLGNKNNFTTDSYHPHLINEDWLRSKKEFWLDYTSVYSISLHFFGAGCLSVSNREKLKEAFLSWGFEEVKVESDILGAAIASFGSEDGMIGILGTGSVIAKIEGHTVKEIYGGLGSVLGDEGSGYFFGKLLLQKYFHGSLSETLKREIENQLGDRDLILKKVYSTEGKKFISSLSKTFSESAEKELKQIHCENIDRFLELYLPKDKKSGILFFNGSYAFHNKENLSILLQKRSWKLGGIIDKPIKLLTEYLLKATF